MVSTADVVCVVIFVGLILLEGHRGLVLGIVDFVGVLVVVLGVRQAYIPLSGYFGSGSSAYMILLGVGLLLLVVLSAYLARTTKLLVGGGEAAGGALLGMCSAAVLCFAFFEIMSVRYGPSAPIITRSLFHSQVYELRGAKAFGEFMRTLMGR